MNSRILMIMLGVTALAVAWGVTPPTSSTAEPSRAGAAPLASAPGDEG